jgi:glycogen(starch) synthase
MSQPLPESKPRPRLCLFTRTWRSSGTGLFAQELAKGLVEAGADVTFIAPRAESSAFEERRRGLTRIRQPRERGPETSRFLRIVYSLCRIAGGALAIVRARLSNRVFVVTIPDPLLFAIPMLFLLRLSGAHLIFIAHDPVPHAWRLPAVLRRLELAGHAACYYLANAVVVLSEPSRTKIRTSFPHVRRPIYVIEHGVFMIDDAPPLPGNGHLLLFGTIRKNKGVKEAIEGVIMARKAGAMVRLIVAGSPHRDDKDYCDQCATLASTCPEAVVMRVGYVPDEELGKLFAQTDALLMPYTSFFSQSGVALLAASNARPVIASTAGGIGSLIAEGMPATTITSPITAPTVASAVHMFLATSADIWRQRASDYRTITLERRAWPLIGKQYLDVACQLAARNSRV